MNNNILKKTFGNVSGLLIAFNPNVVDYAETTQQQIIEDIVKMDTTEILERTLREGRELLKLEPFPWGWVADVYDSLVYDEVKQQWVEDPLLYHKWLTNVLDALEAEARKQGKL